MCIRDSSILFLVSKNLGILVMLLLGSMAGNTLAYQLQPADRYSINGDGNGGATPLPELS